MKSAHGVTEKVLTNLIENVLASRAPDKLPLLASIQSRMLAEDDREAIREVLADELLESGLGPDSEPNERGRLIEAAIDWLGHR